MLNYANFIKKYNDLKSHFWGEKNTKLLFARKQSFI